jgi:hypothetical protein
MGQQTKESSLLSLILGTQQIKLAVLSQELGLFVRMEFDSPPSPPTYHLSPRTNRGDFFWSFDQGNSFAIIGV